MTVAPVRAEIDRRAVLALAARATILSAAAAAAAASAADAAPREPRVTSEDHWVTRGAARLYVYRKRAVPLRQGPVVFLVHGSSFSGRGGFDLQVPGRPDYSVMDWLARGGFDVWTMDHENYGRSSRSEDIGGIDSGVADLAVAFELIERITGSRSLMVYGQSSGALRAGVFAMRSPDRVDRLVLDAFTYTGDGAPEILRRRQQLGSYRAGRFRPMSRATIQAIFERDDPRTFDPAVARALADHEVALTDRIPNGTYIDMASKLPMVDPQRLHCPVMVTRAQSDANATDAEILDFFGKLASKDRQFVMMSNVAHVAMLGIERKKLWMAMDGFFRLPLDPPR